MLGLKVAGISLLISGCGGWGLNGARHMEQRVEQLKELRLSMAFLEKEITCMFTPLSLALERTASFCESPVSGLYRESAARLNMRQGVTMLEAWMKGIDFLHRYSNLKADDTKLLANAGRYLGMSEASEQRKILLLIQEELRLQEDKARLQRDSGHKLWIYGGFALGAVVVILLL